MTQPLHEITTTFTEINPVRRSFLARVALLPLQAAKRGLDEFFSGMGLGDDVEPLGADAQFAQLSSLPVPQPRAAEQAFPGHVESKS